MGHGLELAGDGEELGGVDELDGLGDGPEGRRRGPDGEALVVGVADGDDFALLRGAAIAGRGEEGLGDVGEGRGLPADGAVRVDVLEVARRHDVDLGQDLGDPRQVPRRRIADPLLVGVRDDHHGAAQGLDGLQEAPDAVLDVPQQPRVLRRHRGVLRHARRHPARRRQSIVVVQHDQPQPLLRRRSGQGQLAQRRRSWPRLGTAAHFRPFVLQC
mmetsp:Transcript_37605/g.120633  ORF Transcript_37605/g.120633 Transcript_37605/m.120633 type:complete len:215 (-) Transcript_37605:49-693(-)